MSMILAATASLILAGAPYCPTGHTQMDCDSVWAASQAIAAAHGQSDARQISAGATAYLAAQASPEPPTILPTQVRMTLLFETTDILSQLAGTTVVLKRAIMFRGDDALVCGVGLFGNRPQMFFFNGTGLKVGATAKELAEVGCNQGGGVLLADY